MAFAGMCRGLPALLILRTLFLLTLPIFLRTGTAFPEFHPLATVLPVCFCFFSRWGEPLGEVPGKCAWREPGGGLLSSAQTCRLAGDFSIGVVFWVTPRVTLVVHSVRSGVTCFAPVSMGFVPFACHSDGRLRPAFESGLPLLRYSPPAFFLYRQAIFPRLR
jgi:hypothetical protein